MIVYTIALTLLEYFAGEIYYVSTGEVAWNYNKDGDRPVFVKYEHTIYFVIFALFLEKIDSVIFG